LSLIITEHQSFIFQTHLASHGFVMARIQIPDHNNYSDWDFQMVDWPRDFLFVLDQIGSSPPEGLEGVIDSDNVGATGYSYGGDISLALSGVRIDPEYYLSYCKQPPMNELRCRS
jgi:predicted dienelactone hydrolase